MEDGYPDHTPWNICILLLLGMVCGFLAGLCLTSQDSFIIWLHTWSTLIGAATALIAGAMAYRATIIQIYEERSKRNEEKKSIKTLLSTKASDLYHSVLTIHALLQSGNVGIYLQRKNDLIAKLDLPEAFYDDIYLLRVSSDFAYNVSLLRKDTEYLKEYLSRGTGDHTEHIGVAYRCLNQVFQRLQKTFEFNQAETLLELYEREYALDAQAVTDHHS